MLDDLEEIKSRFLKDLPIKLKDKTHGGGAIRQQCRPVSSVHTASATVMISFG